MHNPDKVYYSNFASHPEFESIYEYDKLYDFDFNETPDRSWADISVDDPDEFFWDDL